MIITQKAFGRGKLGMSVYIRNKLHVVWSLVIGGRGCNFAEDSNTKYSVIDIHKFSSVYPINIQVKHIQYVHTICANIVCTYFSNTWKHNLFLLVLMFWGQTGSPSMSTKQKLVREDKTWQNGILSILAVTFIKVWTLCQKNNLLPYFILFKHPVISCWYTFNASHNWVKSAES